jgi:hypothetical protein
MGRKPSKDEIKPGADLRGADLRGAYLTHISYNNKTKYDKGSPLDIYIKKNK